MLFKQTNDMHWIVLCVNRSDGKLPRNVINIFSSEHKIDFSVASGRGSKSAIGPKTHFIKDFSIIQIWRKFKFVLLKFLRK